MSPKEFKHPILITIIDDVAICKFARSSPKWRAIYVSERSRNSLVFSGDFVWCSSTMKLRYARTSIDCHVNYHRLVARLLFAFPTTVSRVAGEFCRKNNKHPRPFPRHSNYLVSHRHLSPLYVRLHFVPRSLPSFELCAPRTNCFLRIGSSVPSFLRFYPCALPFFFYVSATFSLSLSLFLSLFRSFLFF